MNPLNPSLLRQLADRFLPEAIALRHELHRIPELAGQEVKTSRRLREALAPLPLEVLPPFLGTDVVALLGRGRGGRNITLRADIDALPVQEQLQSDHVSTHPGRMHACGHDGHAAMLYGAIRILCEVKDQLPPGSVRFVFQPGEEVQCLAKPLVEAGALQNPPADFVAALHGWPNVPHGHISTRVGANMAAAGFFHITITGHGGHGSMPRNARNPIPAAGEIAAALCTKAPEGTVCTVCHIDGGSNTNIIPGTVLLEGTTRYLDEALKPALDQFLRGTVNDICAREGLAADIDYRVTYPVTNSTDLGVQLARQTALECLDGAFTPMPRSSMSSEDFAFFLQNAPDGVFAHLGLGTCPPLHSPTFEFDDTVLKTGMLYFAGLVFAFLRS